ncbi:hypothetical protein WISP_87675 [Willisornis vidua]|uniref:Uncharacterized protein n=1 Tax=Willisornis vidua TaxID=1566151 RepID=A0ABQ9D8C3_9PASS|nr:hypothetical protein WISP_87675 [Willisornis vidua]
MCDISTLMETADVEIEFGEFEDHYDFRALVCGGGEHAERETSVLVSFWQMKYMFREESGVYLISSLGKLSVGSAITDVQPRLQQEWGIMKAALRLYVKLLQGTKLPKLQSLCFPSDTSFTRLFQDSHGSIATKVP